MKSLVAIGFGLSFGMALLLVTMQYFFSPLYLEVEYEFAGFPPPRGIDRDERYVASQAFLSYLNVENGGATLLSLSEMHFDDQRFFSEGDLSCIFHAKELRGTIFGLTFIMGVVAIALGLFSAADDFDRARRMLLLSVFGVFLVYTLISIAARVDFDVLVPMLTSFVANGTCTTADVRGLPQIFPPMLFRDGLVLLALFGRAEAVLIGSVGWLFGIGAKRLGGPASASDPLPRSA